MMAILGGIGLGTGISMIVSAISSAFREEKRWRLRKDAEASAWRNDVERRLDAIEGKLRRLATWEDDLHNPFFVRKEEKNK